MTELQDTSEHQHVEIAHGWFDRWAKFWLLLIVTSVPMLYPYFTELWTQEHYRFFPFCFIAVGYLLYLRWDRRFYPPKSWISWVLIAIGVLANVFAALMVYPLFAAFGFAMIGTCCLSSMKGPGDRSLIGIAVPLWMVVQLPLRADRTIVSELQVVTTRLSSVVLDLLSVPHAVSGNVLQLADRELFVAEACSGIQSVFTLMFIACLMICVFRLRILLLPAYIVVATLLAIVVNILRVTTIAVAHGSLGVDLASGWMHDLVGYFCLAIAIALLFSFHCLVSIVFHDTGDTSQNNSEVNPVAALWNFIIGSYEEEYAVSSSGNVRRSAGKLDGLTGAVSLQVVFLLVVVSITCVSTYIVAGSERQTVSVGEDGILFDPPKNLISGSYETLRVVSHFSERGSEDARLGKNADVWVCEVDGQPVKAQVALSQSYHGWKELCECYEVRDWELVDRTVRKMKSSNGDENRNASFVRGRFRSAKGHHAYLLFSAIRPDGTVLPAITELAVLGNRFVKRFERSGVWLREDVMMLQLWFVTNEKLSQDGLQSIEDDFLHFRELILEGVRSAEHGPATEPTDQS